MSILPIGQSEQPESPYRLSNYELWSQGKLHPAPLSRKAVDKLAVTKTLLAIGSYDYYKRDGLSTLAKASTWDTQER